VARWISATSQACRSCAARKERCSAANTIGGAVLLTTNAPGEGAGNTLRLGVGEDNLFEGFAAFDIPISETWAARASVGFRQRDGYVTRAFDGKDLGDENTYSGQAALRWTPSANLTFTGRVDYANEDENGSPFVFQSMNEAALFVGAASIAAGCPNILDGLPPPTLVGPLDDDRCGNDAQARGPFTNGGTFPASSSLENFGASLVAEWELSDAVTLKSITSNRHPRMDRLARRRQHAIADPAHELRE
jgi:iron complex outermembrane receptor protein